jgi:hypothetical protein
MKTPLDEIKARLAGITPGNWIAPGSTGVLGSGVVSSPSGRVIVMSCPNPVDAEFIASAPIDIAWLITEIERLQKLAQS